MLRTWNKIEILLFQFPKRISYPQSTVAPRAIDPRNPEGRVERASYVIRALALFDIRIPLPGTGLAAPVAAPASYAPRDMGYQPMRATPDLPTPLFPINPIKNNNTRGSEGVTRGAPGGRFGVGFGALSQPPRPRRSRPNSLPSQHLSNPTPSHNPRRTFFRRTASDHRQKAQHHPHGPPTVPPSHAPL